MPWYRDRAALALIGNRYLPLLAALSLAWEIVQLPLYTLWREASPGTIAFAVAHCTAGDVLIGAAALALALGLDRARELAQWRWRRVALWSALIAAMYALFSESMNTSLGRWTYSAWMPIIRLWGLHAGLAPLAQWLVIPPLSLYLAMRSSRASRLDSGQSAPDRPV